MQPDESDKSLGDGGTFAGEPKRERAEASLGDEATFAGAARRRSADASLGDERTLGGEAAAGLDTVIDDIEVVDLEARYKPEGTLGRGGMGEVLLALDTRLGRKVAIKRILGEAARSKTAVSRFLTEAKAIAAISHPNVVQIYDYGRAKDGPFLIMEYVDGSSLLDRCRDGAIPLEEAVDLACQLCDGLGKAHDLGIVHRDIKPANVLLTKDGLPKLTDFGLAKAEAADHQMTMTGAVLGTPDFMPPEQRRDAALVDARSDLWSLAATLYQMVTGRSPKIIRFDLLPAVLTQVLGKALEEAKEDRFQTARELRDALKASLVAAAPAVAELGEGQCPACGVKNDSSRRFCRGCGESLEAPCLSCAKPMPMWEEICGQCGTKQAPLLETRRGEMAAQQAEAEGLLKEYGFEHAEQITVTLRDEADPRLKQLAPWATAFLPKIAAARDAQLSQAVAALIEALKHEASFDYPSAIHALEQVPEILRSRPLGGQAETVAAVLARVATKQAEVERLESLVKARISAKELGGLLTEVRKLQGLRPDRADVDKLCTQLEERQQKLVVHRDEALKLAQAHFDAKDYESVIAVLRKVDRSVETPEVGRLRDAANVNIKCLQDLMREISQAVSLKQLDGLMPKVQTALSLRPGHPELLRLLDNLQSREEKVAAGVKDVVSQADEAFKACRFDKAVALLHRIPENRRSSEVTDLLDRSEYLAMTKAGVISGFEGLPKGGDLAEADGFDLSGLATRGRSYLGQIAAHGLADPAIEQWCVRCAAAAEKREEAEKAERLAKANLRRVLVGAGVAVAAIVFVAVGLAVRSSWQSAAIQAALTRGEWQTVLKLDAKNVSAIVGVAKSKLANQPPDIEGAFNELELASSIAPTLPEVQATLAAAHVARANELIEAARLEAAAAELEQASRHARDVNILGSSKNALARAFVERAISHAKELRLDEAAVAVKQAFGSTTDKSVVIPAQKAIYDARIACAQTHALAGRIKEAEAELEEARRLSVDQSETVVTDLLAAGWMQRGESAILSIQPADARIAHESARKYNADPGKLASLMARILIEEAIALNANGESRSAAAKIAEAMENEVSAVRAALGRPVNKGLQEVIADSYCTQINAALSRNDLDDALRLVCRAALLDAETARKATATLNTIPGGISKLPSELVWQLPRSVIQAIPSRDILQIPPIKNSLGIVFRLLPAGQFVMGEEENVRENPHKVLLTQPFYIGVYEVTNSQWTRVMGSVPSRWADPERPVERVCLADAKEFCKRLSIIPEEKQAGRAYRLPAEAEWEYACRASSNSKYCFGNDTNGLGDYAWFVDNSNGQTHPVGQKKPNAWGLFDMHGNVWEWCADWYAEYGDEMVVDPMGAQAKTQPVHRGGSWDEKAYSCRSAYRYGLAAVPDYNNDTTGLRLVLTPPEARVSAAHVEGQHGAVPSAHRQE